MLSCALDGAARGLEPAAVCLRRGVHLEHRARRRAPLHASSQSPSTWSSVLLSRRAQAATLVSSPQATPRTARLAASRSMAFFSVCALCAPRAPGAPSRRQHNR